MFPLLAPWACRSSAGEEEQPSVKVLPFFHRGQFRVARNKDSIFVLKDFFPGKL